MANRGVSLLLNMRMASSSACVGSYHIVTAAFAGFETLACRFAFIK